MYSFHGDMDMFTFHFNVGGVQHAAKMKANATSVKGSSVMYLVNIYTKMKKNIYIYKERERETSYVFHINTSIEKELFHHVNIPWCFFIHKRSIISTISPFRSILYFQYLTLQTYG